MSYWKWNEALGDYFFRQSRPGQQILLYLDRKLISKIGAAQGIGGWDEFCDAVQTGPVGVSFPDYLADLMRSWPGTSSRKPPFFLNGIAVLVLAWTERPDPDMGYYDALDDFCQRYLGQDTFPKSLVKKLVDSFETIRIWSQQWPEFPGTFVNEAIQDYKYVGRIKHHALLSPLERENLHFIWKAQRIDHQSKPDSDLLIHLTEKQKEADQWIPQLLRLFEHRKQEVRNSIRDWIGEEFRNWNGTAMDAPHEFIPNWEEQFELRISLAPREAWGLRLFHPTWKGPFKIQWKEYEIEGKIEQGGWSEIFRVQGKALNLDYSESIRPITLQIVDPVQLTLKHYPSPFFLPAGVLGAFGADYIDATRPLSGVSFYHLFPNKDLNDWRKWSQDKKAQRWRERDAEIAIPPAMSLFFSDQIVPIERDKPSPSEPPTAPEPKPALPLFPIRAKGFETAWKYNPNGGQSNGEPIQISHYSISGVERSCASHSEWTIPLNGKAEAPPAHTHLLAPLLRKGKSEILFQEYYDLLADRSQEIDWPIDKMDARMLRRQTASLGYFFEDRASKTLQLAPPSVVLFPDNRYQIRAMLMGIWTAPLMDLVAQFCAQKRNGLQLSWIEQDSPFLPPTGQVICFQLRHLEQLLAVLNEQFPGLVGSWLPCSYAQTLLDNLTMPDHRGWFTDHDGNRTHVMPPLDYVLSPQRYVFQTPNPIPHFPVLSRSYHSREAYPMFTWWEDESNGFFCNGDWAVWRLLSAHKVPLFFVDGAQPDRIFLPAFLPLPPLVERALTLASGKIGPFEEALLPSGKSVMLRGYEDIRFPMRRALVRLLCGLPIQTTTDAFFHPISFPHTTKPLKNGSTDQ